MLYRATAEKERVGSNSNNPLARDNNTSVRAEGDLHTGWISSLCIGTELTVDGGWLKVPEDRLTQVSIAMLFSDVSTVPFYARSR